MNWPFVIGIVAASITVVATISAVIRRIRRGLREWTGRVERLEAALQARRTVRTKQRQLAACHGTTSDVVIVEQGTEGVLVRVERGIATVRLDNSQTVIDVPLADLDVVS